MPMEGSSTSKLTSNGVAKNIANTAQSISTAQPTTPLPELDASLLQKTLTNNPRPVPELNSPEIAQSKTCTDHMITASWSVTNGWEAPELKPYGPLSLMPTASVLHYATECFEGMKLYRGYDGKLRLFRPNLNCNRMLMSSSRIALPGFDPLQLEKLVMALCEQDGSKWLPKDRPGNFLYIRPTMIASDSTLGVQRPKEALLYIILCCFPVMDASTAGMKLLASQDDMVRAWPGGFGYAKVGANYGPSLVAQGEARRMGYDQILWLFGDECNVTEAGASNFFVVWKTKEGVTQLVTAPLGEKIILDGITRRSTLELARTRLVNGWTPTDGSLPGKLDAIEVVERKFTMKDIEEAYDEGRFIEAFVAGTAFFVGQVSLIHFRGKDLNIEMREHGYATTLKGWLSGIMYGKEKHEWAVIVNETES
ncbi:branched-chain amino acid aminotransferase [Pseudovirgaria hyperparasitica]|uniref:Branched-chain-amino-acid aminotransferase n=1 Tax=Pseudovirgaria hyperparasitica TaxID=470096 RepID=A0A6A6WDR3_9PEZI|nr:branched-chain amino acid aminotransferase [Pseudovirgaria hyperparasitica]KAF2759697.1 branched-chain amino acid aminotransferase [Pseudovirgaria hyperparasitica]